jgi:hypothetical protein
MIERFIAAITKRLRSKTVLSIADSTAPLSEFITDDIVIDYPSTGVCTFSLCITYAQTNRFIFIPAPIAPFWMFSYPNTLKRQILYRRAIKFLSLRRRVGKQTER